MKTKLHLLLGLVLFSGLISKGSALGTPIVVTYQGRVTSHGTNFTGAGQFKTVLATSTNNNHAATAIANLSGQFVTSVTVTFGGNGYVTPPAVSFSGGGGSGAAATATVSGGSVSAITVNNAGSGYTSPPTVTIAAPPENVTFTTFWSNDGTSSGGSEPAAAVSASVAGGLFVLPLGDTSLANMSALDSSLFTQPDLKLRLWFNDGLSGFAVLTPPQNLTYTPYAAFAVNSSNLLGTLSAAQLSGAVPSASLAGTYSSAVTFDNAANTLSGNGSGLTSLNANSLSSGAVPSAALGNAWKTTGNSGTTPGSQFIGTSDNQPLELKVKGLRALRLEPTSDAPNVLGGYLGNFAAAGVSGATIAGGGSPLYNAAPATNSVTENYAAIGGGLSNTVNAVASVIAGGYQNSIEPAAYSSAIGGGGANRIRNGANDSTIAGGGSNLIDVGTDFASIGGGSANTIRTGASYSTIAGGDGNTIQTTASASTIGGGDDNTIQTGAYESTIGGGDANTIQTNASYSTIGGGFVNTIQTNADYSTIGGGSQNTIQTNAEHSTIGGGLANTIQSDAQTSTIGGGYQNTIQSAADHSTIGGGSQNTIQTNAPYSTIGGGSANTIQTNADYSTIGGGDGNTIRTNADHSTIGGGYQNTIQTNASYSTIGGGSQNTNSGPHAVVPGGDQNVAGTNSFAAGHRAKATHTGAFAWADSQLADFSSTAPNQFLIRAAGGVGINATNPVPSLDIRQAGIPSAGDPGTNVSKHAVGISSGLTLPEYLPGLVWYTTDNTNKPKAGIWSFIENSGSSLFLGTSDNYANGITKSVRIDYNGSVTATAFNPTSDRNAKENFSRISSREVLDKVAGLPISRWNFKGEAAAPHLGPMAQDFRAAFGLGADDKHIATVDADGVALAAIQGLNEKVEEQRTELKQKQTEITELKQAVRALRDAVSDLAAKQNGGAR
jgi:hypothetical protein